MKQQLLLIILVLLILSPAAQAANAKTLDLSNSNNSWGFTFGNADERERWQTVRFSSAVETEAIGVKLLKKGKSDKLTDVIVKLYSFNPLTNTPAGEPLQQIALPVSSIRFGEETRLPLSAKLLPGASYAIALTQKTLAVNGENNCYQWPSGERKAGLYSGKLSPNGMVNDTSATQTEWLKIYYHDIELPKSQIIKVSIANSCILNNGSQLQLQMTACNAEGQPVATDKSIRWMTDSGNVSVSDSGIVTANAPGLAKIVAVYDGLYAVGFVSIPAADGSVYPFPGMVIDHSVKFVRGRYDFAGLGGMRISKSGITVDGNGAYIDSGANFENTGLYTAGINDVTITGLSLHLFKTALKIDGGNNISILENNFSNNFSDPDFGWGELPDAGGIVLNNVNNSFVKNNIANNNWDGLALNYCSSNLIAWNDFSHSSNVCLKMWQSSDNLVSDNNLSYGIRIAPGEVHARDSTSVLIETGSNSNRFRRNDCSHGGDGIFIRSLNGWQSEYNIFESNDCSWANNNGFESWSDNNTYINNIANHCSYGFWLGASDNTVVTGNEAAFNGCDSRNAPERFGNAGIAVVNGSSSNFKITGNYIHDNNGPGLAIGYNKDYPAQNWIIENNRFENNRTTINSINNREYYGYGIFLKNARNIFISGNKFDGNDGQTVKAGDNCENITIIEGDDNNTPLPAAVLTSSRAVSTTSDAITFSAAGSSANRWFAGLEYSWDFGDGNSAKGKEVAHTYSAPGMYRACLTVRCGKLADIAWQTIIVMPSGEALKNSSSALDWNIQNAAGSSLASGGEFFNGSAALEYRGVNSNSDNVLSFPRTSDLNLNLTGKQLGFAFKYFSEGASEKDNLRRPLLRLYTGKDDYFEFTPEFDYCEQLFAADIGVGNDRAGEYQSTWRVCCINLEKPQHWTQTAHGSPELSRINTIELVFGNHNPGSFLACLSGFTIIPR